MWIKSFANCRFFSEVDCHLKKMFKTHLLDNNSFDVWSVKIFILFWLSISFCTTPLKIIKSMPKKKSIVNGTINFIMGPFFANHFVNVFWKWSKPKIFNKKKIEKNTQHLKLVFFLRSMEPFTFTFFKAVLLLFSLIK